MRNGSLGRGLELIWAGQCGAGQCGAGRVDAGRYGTVTGGWGGGTGRGIAGQKQKQKNPRPWKKASKEDYVSWLSTTLARTHIFQ